MCGIVGIMRGSMTEGMVDMFEQLLYADVFRGPHATGVYRTNANGTSSLFKEAIPASLFLGRKGWDDLRGGTGAGKEPLGQVYVGHNRWATVGAAGESKNAHPFKEGNITMVHNGTVAKYRLNEHIKYDVDSHAVCAMLNSHGLAETLKVLDGKFTLVWHDSSDNTMNFIRNAERPLHMVEFTDGGWAFASEGEMLTWINGRRKSPFGIKRTFELPVGFHHKFQLSAGKVELAEVVKYDLPKFPTYSQSSYYQRSSVSSSASSASNQESGDDRKLRLMKEWGIDVGGKKLNDIIFALDNIAFTPYSSSTTTGRIDADLWGYDSAVDEVFEQTLEVDSKKGGDYEDVMVVCYGVSMTDWKTKHSQSDNLYGKIDSVYESTLNGRTRLQINLLPASLCGELADGVEPLNDKFFPLLIKEVEVSTTVDADKSADTAGNTGSDAGTGQAVSKGTELAVVVDNTAGKSQTASAKSDKLFNLSGVPYSVKDLAEDKLSCSWCGNGIHQHNYEMSDMFFRSHICETCAKDLQHDY
ncbi:hypothetical protein TacPo2_12 [Pantoea bacteriophage TacPo2]